MDTSSQVKLGRAYDLIDEDTIIEIKDSRGNVMYIDRLNLVIHPNNPTLSIELAPF